MRNNRRGFLRLVGTGALASTFPATIERALAIPAHHRTGTIEDVEHIVILMQENRSFDHYFGTLRGVRGFDDPRAVRLPSGAPVWQQPAGGGHVAPFHPAAPGATPLGLAFIEDLPHGWTDTHAAWNAGKWDQWVPAKGNTTMAYLDRRDIPFHFALADAFTVCDAYHCSFLGATDPNRYHMWTGWVGNDGLGGGPVLDNSEAGYDWATFPERLTRAGISWKIYQDAGAGLDGEHFWGWGDDAYIGNYGDNSLLYFHQYQNAQPGSALHQGARSATNISGGGNLVDQFRADVAGGTLPRVSWVVAPEAYTEHPNWPANYGAWYIAQFLDALTAAPEVWSKTAFFLTYDENDGFFDHMVSPTPPGSPAEGWSTVDTANELFAGNARYAAGPIGFGPRVPMIVISPWSRGGWVNSELFDHTSLIRFIEERHRRQHPDIVEPNITRWRRAVAGDLTSAFDFRAPNDRRPGKPELPSTDGYVPPDRDRHPDYVPPVPAVDERQPTQEPGTRPARPVPYELHAIGELADGSLSLHLANTGKAAAVFQVRSSAGGPWTFTLAPDTSGSQTWPVESTYDLEVYGPNGFLRSFKGSVAAEHANLSVTTAYEPECTGIRLDLENRGGPATLLVRNAYDGKEVARHRLRAGGRSTERVSLDDTTGWYDLIVTVEGDSTFEQRVAGHVENGRDTRTDPAIGRRRRGE
jgi:phospholipase C